MDASDTMSRKKSTCLYLEAEVVGTARRLGLNLSKISENALVQAIDKLRSPEWGNGLGSRTGAEGRDRDSNPGGGLHRPVG